MGNGVTLLDELKVSTNLKVLHDGRRRSLLDYSGNGLTLTTLGTGNAWGDGPMGPGLTGTIDTGYSAGTSATLDLTTATVFAAFQYYQTPAAYLNHLIMCKGENLGTLVNGYYMYISAGFVSYCLGDAALFQAAGFLALTPGRIYLAAFSFDGAWIRPFVNGAAIAPIAQTRIPSPAGKVYKYGVNGTAYGLHDVLLHKAGVINRVLTGAEQARLYTDFLADRWCKDLPRRGFVYKYPSKNAAEYAAANICLDTSFESEMNGVTRRIKDFTNNYPGAITNLFVPSNNEGSSVYASSMLTYGAVAQVSGATKATFVFDAQWDSILASGRYMAQFTDGVANAIQFLCIGGGGGVSQFRCTVTRAGVAAYGETTGLLLRGNQRQHVAVVYDGTGATNADRLKIYLDGELVALTFSGSIAADLGPGLVGYYGINPITAIHNAREYQVRTGVALSATQIRALYLEWPAKQLLLRETLEDVPVSLVASVGAGGKIGPWDVIAGTWKDSEDSTGKRWLECVTAGDVVMPIPDISFGTHTFYVQKHQLPSDTRIVLGTSRSPVGTALAGSNGYCTILDDNQRVRMSRYAAGIIDANLWVTANGFYALDTPYAFTVARRVSDGRFQQWIKGGAYTVITTTGGPAADVTYAGLVWLHFQGGAGDKICLYDPRDTTVSFNVYQGGLDPTRNEVPGVVSGWDQTLWTWTTTDLTQNHTIRVTTGTQYRYDWGDGSTTWGIGNGADQAIAHNYAAAGTYTMTFQIADPTKLERFQCNANSLVGQIPNLNAYPALVNFYCNTNLITGNIPILSNNPALRIFYVYANQITGSIPSVSGNPGLFYFHVNGNLLTGTIPNLSSNPLLSSFACGGGNSLTGSIPSLSGNPALLTFYCDGNLLTGSIPSLTANVALTAFYCDSNQITGYTPSVISATCITFNAQTNNLTQAAVDQILADFATGVAGRPAVGTITLNGVGNAAPSAAGLASKAAILAAKPGWTILNN